MPSLRRTVSESASPARMSPYPSSLSLSAAGALNAGVPIRPRRVASETPGRRVLADIEWWRILDGQQEEEGNATGNGNENENDQNTSSGSVAELQPALEDAMQESYTSATATTQGTAVMIDSVDEASAVLGGPDASQGASSLTTPFAALSISPAVPMTPPMTPPRIRNALQSPSLSAVSTPESSPRTPPRLHESLFMGSPTFDYTRVASDYDEDFCTPLPPFLTVRGPKGLHSLAMMRSISFGGFDTTRESEDERFSDVIFV
ncbi:hypothetical protein ACEPAF_4883 [Sanghuangporus sanghuang]